MISSDFEAFSRDFFRVQLGNLGNVFLFTVVEKYGLGRVRTSSLTMRGGVCILGKRLGQF